MAYPGGTLVTIIGPGLLGCVVLLLALVIALVLGVAYGVPSDRSESTANGCAFEAATTLVADDATESGPTETTDNGSGLSIGTRSTRDAGKSHSENSKFREFGFHRSWFLV